jgi:putative transposase
VLSATWQSCRVHFMRNALAYAGRTQRRIIAAWIGTAFAQDDAAAARKQRRDVADQARPRVPKLAALMDEAEADVLAYMGGAAQGSARAAGGMAAEASRSSTGPSCTAHIPSSA